MIKINTQNKKEKASLLVFGFISLLIIAILLPLQLVAQDKDVIKGDRPPIELSTVPEEAYEKGLFRIKFEERFGRVLDVNEVAFNDKGIVSFGIQGVDSLNALYGIKSVNKTFQSPALKNNFSERHRKWGFHLWYDIIVEEGQEIIPMVKAYMGLEEIAFAEPYYKKQLIGNVVNENEADHFIPWSEKRKNDGRELTFPDDPEFDAQWHYHNVGQTDGTAGADISLPAAWDIATGSPEVIVAILDGGIAIGHPDLELNIWEGVGYNFVDNSSIIVPHNHGTHVAGTVGAVNNNGIGVSGVAGGWGENQGISLMSAQIFGESASDQGGFHLAPIYAADNGAAISQNSWGYISPGFYEQAVLDAIDYFNVHGGGDVLEGGLTIFSAGNSGNSDDFYPAYYEGVLAVAATNHNDQLTGYSTYGHQIDLSAPGGETSDNIAAGVLSTVMQESGYGYAYYQGTSMASPHVSGVVALMISLVPGQLMAEEIKDILLASTDDISHLNPDYADQMGAGRLNAYEALIQTLIYGSDPAAPAAPGNLTATAGLQGELFAEISWVNPSLTVLGDPLESLDAMLVFRNDILIDSLPDPEMGATVTFTDEGVEESGMYKYTVRGVNVKGKGARSVKNVFIGEDLPGKAVNVELITAGSNGVLTWENPLAGSNGGYYDQSSLVFDVYRFPGEALVVSEYPLNSFLDTDIQEDGNYFYQIIAKNDLGVGDTVTSPRRTLGGNFLIYEDFDIPLGTIPEGWEIHGLGQTNWGVHDWSHAGGEAPQMAFDQWPFFQGRSRLVTYTLDVGNYDELKLNYKTFVMNLTSGTDPYEISVKYTIDGWYTWETLMSFGHPTADYGPLEEEFNIQLPEYAETFQIAFKWDAPEATMGWKVISDWTIDDVILEAIGDYFGVFFEVSDDDGLPVSDALVTIHNTTGSEVGQGHYFFRDMVPGSYEFLIEKEDFHAYEGSLEVTDNDVVEIITLMAKRYNVTFEVMDETGAVLNGATITLDDQTNEPGQYLFEGIPNGYYEYVVEKEGYFTYSDTLKISGEDIQKTITMVLESYMVEFKPVDQNGVEITKAIVVFDGEEHDPGVYVFEGIVPGDYPYTISKEGHDSVSDQVSVTNEDVVVEVELQNIVSVDLPPDNAIIRIHPNPARSDLNIQAGFIIYQLRLIDMLGQVVYTAEPGQADYQLNVSGFNNGVYFIQILFEEGSRTKRLQITR